MKKLAFILFLFSTFSSSAQFDSAMDDRYKFIFNFDMRNSVVIGHTVKFNGVKLGIGNSKHRFGLGFYGLRQPVLTTNRRIDSVDATDTNRYHFGFVSFYYEKIIHQSKRWEFSLPIHFNVGELRGEYWSNEGLYEEYLKIPASSITLSVKSHFKIWRWIGLSGGIGYNLMLNKDFKTRQALNAPFYSFGVKLFLGEAWKITTNKKYRNSQWNN